MPNPNPRSKDVSKALEDILGTFKTKFEQKVHPDLLKQSDVLMDVFSVTPEMKEANPQFWGRELGLCWQLLAATLCQFTCPDFLPALRIVKDEPCDFRVGEFAIDTKYRVGSGDAGTLKKFRRNGDLLREAGYTPVVLFLRDDNLPAALQSFRAGNWTIYQGSDAFEFLNTLTGVDLLAFLTGKAGGYRLED